VNESKARLKSAIDTDGIFVESIRDKQFVGNELGLKRAHARVTMDPVEENDRKRQGNRRRRTCGRTIVCEPLQNIFISFRSRFISSFKRDKLGVADEADRGMILTSNRAAHSGHCKFDADHYVQPNGRGDYGAYRPLYGHSGVVNIVSEFPSCF
jgi:hypothetical protein